jgi:3',5'-cyclic AMP phosphodiesterase CpdA
MKWKVLLGVILFAPLFWSCNSPFSYSPFEAKLPHEFTNTTEKNLQRIAEIEATTSDTFKIGLLSDPHYHFNDLRDALADINSKADISFVIVTGDLTENGLQKEFQLFHQLMALSEKPYLTVIGNHDYLSNGALVYEQMFGPYNYSFTFRNVKFVMWDNVLWESNKSPDWAWMKQALRDPTSQSERQAGYAHILPFSHIPPFDKQLSDSAAVFHSLLRENNVKISIHGHRHTYSATDFLGDGIQYVTVGSPQYRAYAELTITPNTVSVQKVEY